MPFPLAAVIGAAGSIAGGIGSALIGNSGTRQNMQLQAKLNKEQLSYQDALNRNYQNMLWSKQYQAQMSGMKNAGLNPALANGTSVGGATASNSLSAGPTGPSGAMPSIDPVSGAVSAMNAEKDMTIKDNQAKLLDEQAKNVAQDTLKKKEETSESALRNTKEYRDLLLRGMSEQNALAAAQAADANSHVEVNRSTVSQIAKNIEKIASDIDLNKEAKNQLITATWKNLYECAAILQEMKESDARIALHRSTAFMNREVGKTQKELRATETAKQGLLHQQKKESDARTTLLGAQTGKTEQETLKLGYDTKTVQLINSMQAYWNEVEQLIPAEERATAYGQQMTKQMYFGWLQDIETMFGGLAFGVGMEGGKALFSKPAQRPNPVKGFRQ